MIYIGIHSSKNKDNWYKGSGKLLKLAFKEYGKKNFKKENLVLCDSKEHLFEMERLIVDKEFVAREDTYNINLGGGGYNYNKGRKPSEETLKKLSIASSGKNNGMYGRNHTKETLELQSKLKLGIKTGPQSKEDRQKKSIAMKSFYNNNPPPKGLKGSKNPAAKSCKVNGKRFDTLKEAVTYFKVSDYYVKKMDFEWT